MWQGVPPPHTHTHPTHHTTNCVNKKVAGVLAHSCPLQAASGNSVRWRLCTPHGKSHGLEEDNSKEGTLYQTKISCHTGDTLKVSNVNTCQRSLPLSAPPSLNAKAQCLVLITAYKYSWRRDYNVVIALFLRPRLLCGNHSL